MKKRNLFGALATGMLLCACSSDNDAISQDLDNMAADGSQKLILNLSSGGDKMTRAGRPLYSSEAKQDIDHIVLYVVNTGKGAVANPSGESEVETNQVVLVKTIGAEEWKNAVSYDQNGHGKALEISFKGSEKQKLAVGTYDIYAVAYKKATTPNYTFELSEAKANDLWVNTKFFATLTKNTATDRADEIFAGKVSVEVKDGKGADDKAYSYIVKQGGSDKNDDAATLILNRQVAGITGYFQNIPVSVAGIEPTKLRLVASNKSDKMLFTSLFAGETGGENAPAENKNIVNGCQKEAFGELKTKFREGQKAYTVYEIDLSKFFKSELATIDQNGNNDGYVGHDDFEKTHAANENLWANPFNQTGNGPTFVKGSVFAGEFIIPFALVDKQKTFELQLLDADGHILKNWNVGTDEAIKDGMYADGAAPDSETSLMPDDATNKLIYNIYRNHMYSMGIKKTEDSGTDPKPDPDGPDNPEDLSKGENLLLHVNDNWEIIHNMEID